MDARAFDQNRLSARHVTEGTSLPPAASYLRRMELKGDGRFASPAAFRFFSPPHLATSIWVMRNLQNANNYC